MDTLLTILIVAAAALWAFVQLARRFRSRGSATCASSCGGCSVPAGNRDAIKGCPRVLLAGLLVTGCILLFPGQIPAQTATPTPPPNDSELPVIVREIEGLKTAVEEVSGVTISGFANLASTSRQDEGAVVSFGAFELGLSRDIGRNTQVAAALVMSSKGIALGSGFVDVRLGANELAPHLRVGQFDVPFGQDWQFFAAKDRPELSAPLTTDAIMDGGYNDRGAQLFGSRGFLSYAVFVLRGGDHARYGGRLGITPYASTRQESTAVRTLHASVSMLRDSNRGSEVPATHFAIDAEARLGRCLLRAEHLWRIGDTAAGQQAFERGWHLTAAFDAGTVGSIPLTTYARYDTVSKAPTSDAARFQEERFTAGFNATIHHLLILKVEYQHALGIPFEARAANPAERGVWHAQMVVAF